MTDEVKSGREVLNEFFSELPHIEGVNKEVSGIVIRLFQEGRLTNINLTNELMSIREAKSDKDK